jgi:hypothetical protein
VMKAISSSGRSSTYERGIYTAVEGLDEEAGLAVVRLNDR